ncbi:hypothetical protein GCM10011505_21060 [Tistrella bauzanensis]|uniref:Uncharacterized protein n=1 Tax=Tistrella bauzanensis TaxID=657419 RepID=A0ABQ1IGD9_9PROT|nr:hypothetical protein [Tistrella bauzanensis]GGB39290.1 hypothetical protein GCM10011505_21060 [Tistrella bauzanensis]
MCRSAASFSSRRCAAVSICYEGFSSPGFDGVRLNNLYVYGLRIEDPRATGVYVQDGRGIQMFSGKIDGSFGSVVPQGVPAMHLRDTTNLRWRDGFIAGMKGPTLHVEGYTSAKIIDPIRAPGSGTAMITGAAEFGPPSTPGYLPGHVIVAGVTISAGRLNLQMSTYVTATSDAVCNMAQGLFLVDKTSGRRWHVQDDFLSDGGRQFRIWGNVTGQIAVGAAMRVEWDVFPSFRLALRDTTLLRPQEARNEAEVPRLFTEVASNLALSDPVFDGAGYVTMVSTGMVMTADEHSGRVLIDTSTREAWYIAGNDAAGTLMLWYDLTADLAAAIAAGHLFDIATGIDRTIRLIGDRALWQSADRLRQGSFPVTDWKTGGTAIG